MSAGSEGLKAPAGQGTYTKPGGNLGRKKRFGGSLRQRLILLFGLILLPPTILSMFLAWDAFVEQRARAKLQVRQLATLAATYESRFFEEARATLQNLAEEPPLRNGDRMLCRSLLIDEGKDSPEFASLGYFGLDGNPICGSNDRLSNVQERQWFRDVLLLRSFTVSDYTADPDSGYPVIVLALPVYDRSGQLNGILAAAVELFWLSNFISDAELPGESVFFLLDSSGKLLADRNIFESGASGALPRSAETKEEGLGSLRSMVGAEVLEEVARRRLIEFEASGVDGHRRVYTSVALPHGGVTVLFGMPAETAIGWLERDFMARVLGPAAILISAILGVILGTRLLVTRWTSGLSRMAQSYAQGDYNAGFRFAHAPSELRELGEILQLMAGRIEERETALRSSLAQKDILLKEVHHRVKNNLQLVTSLLNLHQGDAHSVEEQDALQDVRARVGALALVHRHLYEGDDLSLVDLRSFMTQLAQATLMTLKASDQHIKLHIRIPSFTVTAERAIPIALLVTEVMTNALKHAFPNGRSGCITLALSENQAAGCTTLAIADDGVGLPEGAIENGGLGFELIRAFAGQVQGEIRIRNQGGTSLEITMPTAHLRPETQ